MPSENEKKLAALLKLGSHYWTPDFTPSQAKHLLADYLEDLHSYSLIEVEIACRKWRQNVASKKFPRSAELMQIVRDYRVERQQESTAKGRSIAGDHAGKPYHDGKSRPAMWWMQPRKMWKPDWRESEAPDDAMVYDEATGQRRKAYRFS